MNTSTRPWLQCVELHPNVLSEDFSEDIFALDLGALFDYQIAGDLGTPDTELRRVPAVYRDASSFFAASYLTSGLKSLLKDVLGRLAGAKGNRILRLQTPFGGGKSHTLAALLHAARSRQALDSVPEATGLPRPENVRVAVVDGQFFDPTVGKHIPGAGVVAKTIWGWIAWALGGKEAYEIVRAQDEARIAPGGDVLVQIFERGPSLILIDELLQYLISAGGIRIEDTTLRDETLSFLQRLTAAVGSVDNTVLVYSLQSSKRESLEYTNVLQIVEHLAARKDQRREPVEGNEILNVIQRRLLASAPDVGTAKETAEVYRQIFTQMRRAYAHDELGRQNAEEDGLKLRDRIVASYPFHPALIDLMRERWAAIPDFQRTRGALRFLASCLRAAHRTGTSRILLGCGDVPIRENEVRLAFLKEVGQREDFQACLEHDFVGANARASRIDERRAKEVTTESGKQPAHRIATTILLSSFGGLRRGESSESDLLPPGIDEMDLFDASVSPDLDTTTIQACLKELSEQCLYLHFDGVRYCFKKDPNVTLLVESEAQVVGHDENSIKARIRQMIEERVSAQSAIVWPTKSADVPDGEAQFLITYLSFEFATKTEADKQHIAIEICEQCGKKPREFRNGIGLALPDQDQIQTLKRSVRYLIAIERIQNKWREHNLTDTQKSQLRERRATEIGVAESALGKLYNEIWLPTSDDKLFEHMSTRGRPLNTSLDEKKRAQIHARLIELLMTIQRRVFAKIAPRKILELFEIGEEGAAQFGISTEKVQEGFFGFIGFPRLLSEEVVRQSIVRGVELGLFGYTTGRPALGEDNRYQVEWNRVTFKRGVFAEEIDLESGFLIEPKALPDKEPEEKDSGETDDDDATSTDTEVESGGGDIDDDETQPDASDEQTISFSFTADKTSVYTAWNVVANLADLAGEVSVRTTATIASGYDKTKLENGVLEPLRELGFIEEQE